MKEINKKKNRAFTLLEVLVAISIFTVSSLALMSVLAQGVSSTNYVKKKIIATYLAQEGIEYVRNMRDTLVISGVDTPTGWGNFRDTYSARCSTAIGCYWDNDSADLEACVGGPTLCPNMTYDETIGIYGYNSSWADSGYNRVITFEVMNNNEVKINSTVEWGQGSGNYSITFSDNLFNWIE